MSNVMVWSMNAVEESWTSGDQSDCSLLSCDSHVTIHTFYRFIPEGMMFDVRTPKSHYYTVHAPHTHKLTTGLSHMLSNMCGYVCMYAYMCMCVHV